MMEIGVVGSGSWGTAVARLLAEKGHHVRLWARNPDLAQTLATERENAAYLPGVTLPDALRATSDLSDLKGCSIGVLAVPSFAIRDVARNLDDALGPDVRETVWVSLTKGLEYRTDAGGLTTMSEALREELRTDRVFALSGPSFAREVAHGSPTTVVLAGPDLDLAESIQTAFMTARFRVYTSSDRRGVELAGATKNVIALAAGISDGLGHGDNAKGALVSRGLVEMTRLGTALSAEKETFFGLAGLGDLVITCMSGQSRNHTVGEQLAQGESLATIRSEMRMVAEGVHAVRAIDGFATAHAIELPITGAVHAVLYEDADPQAQLDALMRRDPKRERI